MENIIKTLQDQLEYFKGLKKIENRIAEVKLEQNKINEKFKNISKFLNSQKKICDCSKEQNKDLRQVLTENHHEFKRRIQQLEFKILDLEKRGFEFSGENELQELKISLQNEKKFKKDLYHHLEQIKEKEEDIDHDIKKNRKFIKEQNYLNEKYSNKFNKIIEKVNEGKIIDGEIFQKIDDIFDQQDFVRDKIFGFEKYKFDERLKNVESKLRRKGKIIQKLNMLQNDEITKESKEEKTPTRKMTYIERRNDSGHFFDDSDQTLKNIIMNNWGSK